MITAMIFATCPSIDWRIFWSGHFPAASIRSSPWHPVVRRQSRRISVGPCGSHGRARFGHLAGAEVLTEYILRSIAGGLFVSLFAIIGDVVRPKSFAGLFGAAPSVALATLGIAWAQHGSHYAGVQASS
jgi:hypothetical protein